MSVHGFYSIVSYGPKLLQIRARRKKDLQRLLMVIKQQAKIYSTSKSDYPYRIFVTKKVWNQISQRLSQDPKHYDNFKDAATKADPLHKKICTEIWWAIAEEYEPFRPTTEVSNESMRPLLVYRNTER